jgi:hypothetical protein
MPFAHATCIVTREETRAHGTWLREFWLTAGHRDWVEVDFSRPEGPRSRPYDLPRLLVMRGPLGELLGQEFLADFPDAEDLLAMQTRLDALRAGEDETRWSAERRQAIAQAQQELEDAVYATPFPLTVTVVALTHDALPVLRRDFEAMSLPRGRFVDAAGEDHRAERTPPDPGFMARH